MGRGPLLEVGHDVAGQLVEDARVVVEVVDVEDLLGLVVAHLAQARVEARVLGAEVGDAEAGGDAGAGDLDAKGGTQLARRHLLAGNVLHDELRRAHGVQALAQLAGLVGGACLCGAGGGAWGGDVVEDLLEQRRRLPHGALDVVAVVLVVLAPGAVAGAGGGIVAAPPLAVPSTPVLDIIAGPAPAPVAVPVACRRSCSAHRRPLCVCVVCGGGGRPRCRGLRSHGVCYCCSLRRRPSAAPSAGCRLLGWQRRVLETGSAQRRFIGSNAGGTLTTPNLRQP